MVPEGEVLLTSRVAIETVEVITAQDGAGLLDAPTDMCIDFSTPWDEKPRQRLVFRCHTLSEKNDWVQTIQDSRKTQLEKKVSPPSPFLPVCLRLYLYLCLSVSISVSATLCFSLMLTLPLFAGHTVECQ